MVRDRQLTACHRRCTVQRANRKHVRAVRTGGGTAGGRIIF